MNDRPTKRERKDEAKQRRLAEMRRRQRRARMRKIYTASVIGLIIAAIAGIVVFSRASNANKKRAAAKLALASGCTAPKSFPLEGATHIDVKQRASYKTEPPTSGNHWASQNPPAPTATGIHAQPVQDEQQVHNLEHGHVVLQYQPNGLTAAQITSLETVVRANSKVALLAPRPQGKFPFALTAWGVKQECAAPTDKIDEVAKDFVKRFNNQGPESVPGTAVFQTSPPAARPSVAPSVGGSVKPSAKATGAATPKSSPPGSAPATPS